MLSTPPRAGSSRGALWLWVLVMVACVAIVATSRFSTDMSAFLPTNPDARQRLLVDQIREGALSRMVLMGIDGGTPQARADASRALAAKLRASNDFIGVVNGDEASRQHDQELVLNYRYLLSPGVTSERFSTTGLHDAISQTVADLSGSAGLILKSLLPRDPTGELVRTLDTISGANMPSSSDGAWASANGDRALLVTMTAASGTDTDAQERTLNSIQAAFDAANPGGELRLVMSGTPVFSVHARSTIKSEVERLSLIGALTVFALLFAVYRSLRNVFIGLIPVASGILVAIATVGLGFDTIHAITIGFGTTLIGESIDYSIYYLVQAHDPVTWRRSYWPTIRLGVATSVCGFAVLLFSSFPGLAQLGAYSVAGLIAAAAVTRFVLPALPTAPVPMERIEWIGDRMASLSNVARRLRWPVAALTLAALVIVIMGRSQLWSEGLSGLNPAPMDLQKLDADLRKDAGAPDLQHMVVVSAATEDAALAAAEQIEKQLQPLIETGKIRGIETPARFMPSMATQQARRSALPEETELRARLAAALAGLPLQASRLEPFIEDVAKARVAPELSFDVLRGTSFAFAVQSLLLQRSEGWSVLMPLKLPEGAGAAEAAAAKAAANALLSSSSGAGIDVFYLDLEEQATSMFGQYLHEALVLAMVGGLCVVILLALALRNPVQVLKVVLPLAGAVVLVMAGHVLGGMRMTLLHLVGLLLIIAVGSNYALFFHQRVGNDAAGSAPGGAGLPRATALASLAMANVSTMIGFGVLSFSKVPVLHAVGATVGPGALLALLLAMSWSGSDSVQDDQVHA
ncbi:MMPL family transporter [Ottowia thiooxydans]|uniref:MMPL family transporter n=1 Tax=Ottowia thiooxydans TaxID=219182 RepID=UPI0003F6FC53|nr:MMPL family transporter [Ottowia thiooxydans]